MRIKWMLGALAFTAAVALIIATAAIKAENVSQRRRIERIYEEVVALEATLEAERLAWRRATDPRRLARMWAVLDARAGE